MVEILTVCTGNICRSPLAELLLRAQLADIESVVASAGTHGLRAAPMTLEAITLADQLGIPSEVSGLHRSRFLLESHLLSPDLILTMSRGHRRHVAELAPSRIRSTFTIREFARLANELDAADIRATADTAGADPSARVRAVGALVASRRGMSPPPASAGDDDVIDPYLRSWARYEMSASQLVPAVAAVARVVRDAVAI